LIKPDEYHGYLKWLNPKIDICRIVKMKSALAWWKHFFKLVYHMPGDKDACTAIKVVLCVDKVNDKWFNCNQSQSFSKPFPYVIKR